MTKTQRIAHIAAKTNTPRRIIADLIKLGEIYSEGGPAAAGALRLYNAKIAKLGYDPLS